MVLHPNMSAVEAVEKFAFDLQRYAGSWERIGREIDQSISELCDDQEPSELVELESYISKQGYDKLIESQEISRSPGPESE
jgi:lipocalin